MKSSILVVALIGCGGSDGATLDAGPGGPDAGPGVQLFAEGFATDGAAWPAGWRELGNVASASVVGGRGQLVPSVTDYSLARMGFDVDTGDVEVTFTMAMDEPTTSGVGFYVRQNGGYLAQTTPTGGGYAVFVEGFRGPRIGVWRERDGAEEQIDPEAGAIAALDPGVAYDVRFRCVADGAVTALMARIWPSGSAEPRAWTVTATDATAALQGAIGGIAVDAWSTATPAGGTPAAIQIDDIVVTAR